MPSATVRHRLLVIANETCPCEALRREVRDRARARDAEVLVVAPALNQRLKHWTSDVDESLARARERLDTIVTKLREDGVRVDGMIGDAQPLTAIDDALVRFSPDELIVSTHPPGRSHWLERGLLERVPEHFDGPVSHFVSAYAAPAGVAT